jgi:hypothetical protein
MDSVHVQKKLKTFTKSGAEHLGSAAIITDDMNDYFIMSHYLFKGGIPSIDQK